MHKQRRFWLMVLSGIGGWSVLGLVNYGRLDSGLVRISLEFFAFGLSLVSVLLSMAGLAGFVLGFIKLYRTQRLRYKPQRPTSAAFLLHLFLSKSDRETIPGDLDEEFAMVILPKFGAPRAWLWYWVQAIRTIAYRNLLCRWLLIGGGIAKVGVWITHRIGS